MSNEPDTKERKEKYKENVQSRLVRITSTFKDEELLNKLIDIVFRGSLLPLNERLENNKLNKAGIDLNADEYYPRASFMGLFWATIFMIITLMGIFLFGEQAVEYLNLSGLDFSTAINIPQQLLPIYFVLESIVSLYIREIVTTAITVSVGLLVFLTIYIYYFVKLRYIINEKERKIDNKIPVAMVSMYAMSESGKNLYEVFNDISKQEEIYGEFARECKKIINRTQMGDDIRSSIIKQAKYTPSDELNNYLTEMISIIEQGTGFTNYFESKTQDAFEVHQRKVEKRKSFKEIFGVFIGLILVTISIVVILTVFGSMFGYFGIDVLLVIPISYLLLTAISLGGIYVLESDQTYSFGDLDVDLPPKYDTTEQLQDKISLTDQPELLLPVNLLFVILYAVLFINIDAVVSTLETNPIVATIYYIYIPYAILTVPYIILYEYKAYKIRLINKEIRPILEEVHESNKQGLQIGESLEQATIDKNTILSNEIENEIKISNTLTPTTIEHSLEKIANKYGTNRIKRSIRLLTDSLRETENITNIIDITVKELKHKEDMINEYKTQGTLTAVIVNVIFFISLVILLILDVQLLPTFMDSFDESFSSGIVTINLEHQQLYQTLILYTGIVSGAFTAYISGALRTGNFKAGLKYILMYIPIVLLAFILT